MNGAWSEEDKLVASDSEPEDRLGIDVSISGAIVVVGAASEDERGVGAGAAYVYELSP